MKTVERLPVMFVGHGSPMNLIERNRWSLGFEQLAVLTPPPRGILAVSAHWYVDGSFVTFDQSPRTIHDFSGFPDALYAIKYPASGDRTLAERVRTLVGAERVRPSTGWGLDHGTWSVLRWMYPDADVPVVQLSIDRRLAPRAHFAIGQALSSLRSEGILILASGNITHNLRDVLSRMRAGETRTPDWALRFDRAAAEAVETRDDERLIALWPHDPDAALAHPTPDHWLPLLYAHGASTPNDRARFTAEGFDLASLSMRSVVYA